MLKHDELVEDVVSRSGSFRARVVRAESEGTVVVSRPGEADGFSCDVLQSPAATDFTLETGDEVLVWSDGTAGVLPVIVGRIGRVRARPVDLPDEVVIEARSNLTLKCGDGSMTIREDGRILIKGRDLVAHARRLNRIRGGSVAIN